MEAGVGGLGEDFEFGGDVAGELAAVRGAATGGDGGGGGVVGEELLELRQGGERLVEVVEAELEEGRLFDDGRGFLDHLGWRGADDGDADFADAGTEKLRSNCGHDTGHVRSHRRNRVSYRAVGQDANRAENPGNTGLTGWKSGPGKPYRSDKE